jgi:hypothetical protein
MHELVANNQNAFIHGQAFMATSRMCSASQSFNVGLPSAKPLPMAIQTLPMAAGHRQNKPDLVVISCYEVARQMY